jgi:hypothetical protein
MWFSAGTVSHGTKGLARVILKDAAGAEQGGFDGLTTTQPELKVAATDFSGTYTHALAQNSGGRAVLNLPNGAGSLQFADYVGSWWQQPFSFNPRRDLTGQDIAMTLVHSDPDSVELNTQLRSATLKIADIQLDDLSHASGVGHLSYDVVVAVSRHQILVKGTHAFDAELSTGDGRTAGFSSGDPSVDTALDW